jgi:hypothetical protein
MSYFNYEAETGDAQICIIPLWMLLEILCVREINTLFFVGYIYK